MLKDTVESSSNARLGFGEDLFRVISVDRIFIQKWILVVHSLSQVPLHGVTDRVKTGQSRDCHDAKMKDQYFD